MPLTPLELATFEESAVGMATKAMGESEAVFLNFVDFTTDLLNNVVQTLTQSTMDQLEAYADLVQAISGSVDAYEQRMYPDLTSDDGEVMRYINDTIGGTYAVSPWTSLTKTGTTFSSGSVTIADDKLSDFIAHFAGVTANATIAGTEAKHAIGDTGIIDNNAISSENLYAFVLAKFRREIGNGYNQLVTILQMGMQQLVVTKGVVETAVSVKVTGQDATTARLNEQSSLEKTISGSLGGKISGKILKKAAAGNLGGKLGGQRSSTSISVRTEQRSASTTFQATMSGRVCFEFMTKTLPPVGP